MRLVFAMRVWPIPPNFGHWWALEPDPYACEIESEGARMIWLLAVTSAVFSCFALLVLRLVLRGAIIGVSKGFGGPEGALVTLWHGPDFRPTRIGIATFGIGTMVLVTIYVALLFALH